MIFELSPLDAVEWLNSLPAESLDLVITDPAYESLEKHRAKGTTTRLSHSKSSSNDWFPIFRNERFTELFAAIYRALKPNTHFYMLCDQETMFVAKPLAQAVGFTWWKFLVWDKQTIGMGYHYRARHELILFFEKGKRRLNDLGIGDVLDAPRVRDGYPTEKPVELLETLVQQSSNGGELVADPFFGSGATGVAALVNGRRFVGADISEAAHVLARSRLQAALTPQEQVRPVPVKARKRTKPKAVTITVDREAVTAQQILKDEDTRYFTDAPADSAAPSATSFKIVNSTETTVAELEAATKVREPEKPSEPTDSILDRVLRKIDGGST